MWFAPSYAELFLHALSGSLLTLLLAAPVLVWGLPATSASAPQPVSAPARSSRVSWRQFVRTALAVTGLIAVGWMLVSFVGIGLDPAAAATWSVHLLGCLFTLVLLAPFVVFLRPDPGPPTPPSEPFVEAESTANVRPASFFASGDGGTTSPTSAAPASTPGSNPMDDHVAAMRSIWSYAEASGPDGAAGDRRAEDPAARPSAPLPSETPDREDKGWPWSAVGSFSADDPSSTEFPSPASSSEGAAAPFVPARTPSTADAPLDTDWENRVWPFEEDDDWSADRSNDDASADAAEEASTWPPADWPTFQY
jgi:hypothetical protein